MSHLRGLSDIEEYDSDELPHEYESDNGEIIKGAFVTFKLPKKKGRLQMGSRNLFCYKWWL